jgi:ketosteroid isomerase-like protein
MNVRAALLCVACCGVFFSCVAMCAAADKPATGQSDANREALRAMLTKYEEAANQGKPDLLKPYLDPDFTSVMVTGDEVDGVASLDAYWAKIQKLIGQDGRYRVQVHLVDHALISGDMAVAHGTSSDEVAAHGKEYKFEGRWTAVCRRRDGQWKVLRIHGSMDPVSNPFVLAAVNGASLLAGAVAGIVGLLLGWILHMLLARRRRTAAVA